jgi:hypothetical protein
MSVSSYSWPDDLPEGCPPGDATPADGLFYRFMNKSEPSEKDFVRPIDRPNADFPAEQQCEASALSLYADLDDVALAQKLIPGFRKKKVAQGKLESQMGVVKNTPSEYEGVRLNSHHDWWLPVDYTTLPPFSLVTS